MWQHEITSQIPLLDKKGELTEPGWARKMYPNYEKKFVKGFPLRLKEWDYYLVTNGRFAVALTIADNQYMGLDSVSFLSFEDEPWEITKSAMSALPLGRTALPSSSVTGDCASVGKGHGITFIHAEEDELGPSRVLTFRMDNFKDGTPISGRITLYHEPEESIVMCTPFHKKGHFYYNQKINCIRAQGAVTIGNQTYRFQSEDSYGVLDWGRGVWTYSNTWYWGSASGEVDGVSFGFNLGYGFGDTTAATENAIFYNGVVHKLSNVFFRIPGTNGNEDYMSPWSCISDDGRFDMEFVPVIDRAACTDAKVLKSDQHQVFGHFTGTAVLDDGTSIQVKDFFGFAEKVINKW